MSAPWLALHGFGGSGADFGLLADRVPMCCPDLLGHGTEPAPVAVEAYSVDAVVARLLKAHPGEHAIIGYSMGGRVALHLALAAPERVSRLVLVGATPGLEGDQAEARRRSDEALAAQIEAHGSAWFARTWPEVPIIRSQERIAAPWRTELQARRAMQSEHGLAGALRGMGTGAMPCVWGRLAELRCPVLLVTGEEDTKFTAIAQRMLPLLPNAQHAILPGAGHCAHLEAPDAFARALEAWAATA